MNVVIIYKFTRLANAPDELFSLLNNGCRSGYKILLVYDDPSKLKSLLESYKDDNVIVHFNNRIINISDRNVHKIVQYHSEPDKDKVNLNVGANFHTLVLNQYHCTLDEYKNCDYIVRNFFSNDQPVIFNQSIKIGYYPSVTTRVNKYYDKGYMETCDILNSLRKLYPHITIDIRTGISYEECITHKRDCHIIIDECKTGSFHKTTIEGLKLGCVVITHINDTLVKKHQQLYGRILPVINSDIFSLKQALTSLITKGKGYIEKIAIENMNEFNRYWNESVVCDEYFDIYDTILGISPNSSISTSSSSPMIKG
jgi:hypothetical protein